MEGSCQSRLLPRSGQPIRFLDDLNIFCMTHFTSSAFYRGPTRAHLDEVLSQIDEPTRPSLSPSWSLAVGLAEAPAAPTASRASPFASRNV